MGTVQALKAGFAFCHTHAVGLACRTLEATACCAANCIRILTLCAAHLVDTDPGDTIPLASVGKEALEKTIEFMEKMAEFKTAGTSEEDKTQWIDEYKKKMEPQDQLPLLFQTMTVRTRLASALALARPFTSPP